VTELEDALGCADCLFVVSDATIRGRIELRRADDLVELGVSVNRLLSGDGRAA
jgi:hypothetical protein